MIDTGSLPCAIFGQNFVLKISIPHPSHWPMHRVDLGDQLVFGWKMSSASARCQHAFHEMLKLG